MSRVLGNRWIQVESQDPSGVHTSEEPLDEKGWRQRLEVSGSPELDPSVEALLNAYSSLQRRYALLEQRATALGTAFNRFPVGVAVVTKDAIIVSNSEAERLIDGVSLTRSETGALEGGEAPVQRKIEVALDKVLADDNVVQAIRVERKGGTTQLAFFSAGETAPDSAIVVIGDPDRAITSDTHLFRVFHGFTPTEAKVAAQLVMGLTPREIAVKLEVGVETTRTHVKHILGKMGCHCQVDAVRRLVVGPVLFV